MPVQLTQPPFAQLPYHDAAAFAIMVNMISCDWMDGNIRSGFEVKKILYVGGFVMISAEIVRCRIPELLYRKRKSQVWLAEKTGISKQRISAYIHLRVIMTIPVSAIIAEALNCKLDDLYEIKVSGIGRE
ncbi:helix-turn-helix transcriptional regulator [Cohnella sp. CBP 2801]|uniref:Helix-turn-helix transcriptional regulator n=2 Tax=Cohnella zeiphila TaxID=2761120 RepID=A0A7X0SL74_9BACL|nr:helix-turn-helix transcriptional regulator [Cohnella zeiphila]